MDTRSLSDRLAELASRHHVPGAGLAVYAGGQTIEAAHGVLNLDTGVAATTDSLFQIGSITKVYTATLAMRLVEQGKLSLDEPAVSYLPGLAVADPDVTKLVTIRHLLTHTSGIDGDHFLDTGRGDDCLERYVDSLADVGQGHPLGATMSYCNAGYALLGRIIEVVHGRTWDAALRELLTEPLGLEHTVTLPEEALLFGTAVGHIGKPTQLRRAPQWGLMRSCGPAGLICARPADLLTFARLHLAGGVAPNGERLLTTDSVRAMQTPEVAVPDRWTLGDHWGLGWILFDWDGRRVYGHDGNTIGQSAFLRIVPDTDVAIALLTNGGNARDLYEDLYRELLAELAGIQLPHRPRPPEPPVPVDPGPYLGRYERASARLEVTEEDGKLMLTVTATGPLASLVDEEERVRRLPLIAVNPAEQLFVTREEEQETWLPVVFFTLPAGGSYVHFGARATPKVG
jgi:CubicO group peptidase (beta-lactamase class C family)